MKAQLCTMKVNVNAVNAVYAHRASGINAVKHVNSERYAHLMTQKRNNNMYTNDNVHESTILQDFINDDDNMPSENARRIG